MSLFSKNSVLKYLFFLELILLLSAGLAFILCFSLAQKDIPEKQAANLEPLFKNYRILDSLLLIDDSQFSLTSDVKTRLKALDNPLLQALYQLENAETALSKRQFKLARRHLDRIKNPNPYISREKNQIYLKILYQGKNYRAFAALYQESPITSSSMRLRYLRCLWQTGKKQEARDLFKALFKRRRLRFFQEELPKGMLATLLANLEADYWYNKCLYLLQRRSYREFLRERNHIKNRDLRYLFSAEFHYMKRRYKRARRLLKGVRNPKYSHQIQRLLLKIDLRNGESQRVKKELVHLKTAKFWYSPFLFNAASLMLAKGETRDAIHYFTEYVRTFGNSKTSPKMSPRRSANFWKAHWLMAWLFYKQRDMRQASLYFKRGKLSPIIPYRIASAYWLSKLNGEPAGQINFYPYSYYFTKINSKNHVTGLNHFVNLINGEQSPAFMEIVENIRVLINHHMTDYCIPYVRFVKRSPSLNWSDRNMLGLIESILYIKRRNFYMAFTVFKNNFPQYHSLRLPHFLSPIYFPVAYRQTINRYSRMNGIDNLLVFALIRNESFFNPNTVSPARAHGLMQLLYRTARQVARKLKIRIQRRDLFKPEINIQLGIQYLKRLLNRYKGRLAPALAAYNAGSTPVNRWLRQFGDVTTEEFIELIPYSETRNYVKNILRNYYFYKFYYRRSSLKSNE